MDQLTIVGLGPGSPGLLTAEAVATLDRSSEVFVRGLGSPFRELIPPHVAIGSLAEVIDGAGSADATRRDVAERLVDLAKRPSGVIYATPGHPLVDDPVAPLARRFALEGGLRVRVIPGISLVDAARQVLTISSSPPVLQILDAAGLAGSSGGQPSELAGDEVDPFAGVYRLVDPTRPCLVPGVADPRHLAAVQRVLARSFPPHHLVSIARLGGTDGPAEVETVPLAELARAIGVGEVICLYLAPVERLADVASFDTLRYIVARLRAPDGCPWDREQTYQSIKKHLLEETYEAIAALDANELPRFAEELGDVLLQVLMDAQMGREAREFDLEDVLRAVNEKLIRRHPHVFGDVVVGSSAEVLRNWERIKRAEQRGAASAFGGIPEAAPALMRADAIQGRAARYGWLLPTRPPSLAPATAASLTPEARLQALGEVLFGLVSLARRYHLDPEEALRLATNRFREAFDRALAQCQARGVAYDTLPPAERRRLLQEALAGMGRRE